MQLRKCCNHPYLIDGVEDSVLSSSSPVPPTFVASANDGSSESLHAPGLSSVSRWRKEHAMAKLVEASGKTILLDKLLPKQVFANKQVALVLLTKDSLLLSDFAYRLRSQGHRVLIFSQFTSMLDILEDYLSFRDHSHERIDGSVSGAQRQERIDRFSAPQSRTFVFLLSTRGCGQGINLTAADTIIMFDSDWNPQNDAQAQARCHRIGQTKPVGIYRLVTRKTYEYEMFCRAGRKMGLDKAIMASIGHVAPGTDDNIDKDNASATDALSSNAAEARRKTKKQKDADMERLLRHGAYAAYENDEKAKNAERRFCEADIDSILSSSVTITRSDGSEDGDGMDSTKMSDANIPTSGGFSKATFVCRTANDVELDDPDFWVKTVGLPQNPRGGSGGSGGGGRRRRAAVDYREKTRIDSEDSDSSLDDPSDRRNINDKDNEGWGSREANALLRGLLTFGYGRWDCVHSVVEKSVGVGIFTENDVAVVGRGCVLALLRLSHAASLESGRNANGKEGSDADGDPMDGVDGQGEEQRAKIEAEIEQMRHDTPALLATLKGKYCTAARLLTDMQNMKHSKETSEHTKIPGLDDDNAACLAPTSAEVTSLETQKMPQTTALCFRVLAVLEEGTRLSEKLRKNSNRYLSYLNEVETLHSWVNEQAEKTTQLKTEATSLQGHGKADSEVDEALTVKGGALAVWWGKREDYALLHGLHKHGWDRRSSKLQCAESYRAILNDPELGFLNKLCEAHSIDRGDSAAHDAQWPDTCALKHRAKLLVACVRRLRHERERRQRKQEASAAREAKAAAKKVAAAARAAAREAKAQAKRDREAAANAVTDVWSKKEERAVVLALIRFGLPSVDDVTISDVSAVPTPTSWLAFASLLSLSRKTQAMVKRFTTDLVARARTIAEGGPAVDPSKTANPSAAPAPSLASLPLRPLEVVPKAGASDVHSSKQESESPSDATAYVEGCTLTKSSVAKIVEHVDFFAKMRRRVLVRSIEQLRRCLRNRATSRKGKSELKAFPKGWSIEQDLALVLGVARHGFGKDAAVAIEQDSEHPFPGISRAASADESCACDAQTTTKSGSSTSESIPVVVDQNTTDTKEHCASDGPSHGTLKSSKTAQVASAKPDAVFNELPKPNIIATRVKTLSRYIFQVRVPTTSAAQSIDFFKEQRATTALPVVSEDRGTLAAEPAPPAPMQVEDATAIAVAASGTSMIDLSADNPPIPCATTVTTSMKANKSNVVPAPTIAPSISKPSPKRVLPSNSRVCANQLESEAATRKRPIAGAEDAVATLKKPRKKKQSSLLGFFNVAKQRS